MMKRLPFRYPLEPLIRKKRSDWQAVKIEEVTAGTLVDRRKTEVSKVRDDIDDAEQTLRQSWRNGMSIDPLQQQLMTTYLLQQRHLLKRHEGALEKARETHNRVLSSLETIGRGIKSLEKHRAGKEEVHQVEQSRREESAVDELWLLGQHENEQRG